MVEKTIFIISPIGSADSEVRVRSDKVLKYIITPIASQFGYAVIRSDFLSEPGLISSQIIDHIIDADLVIADLTNNNPNVYYELAIRHVVQKPVILMIEKGGVIPFDIYTQRVLFYDLSDLETVEKCKNELKNQISMVESNDYFIDSPIRNKISIEIKNDKPFDKFLYENISITNNLKRNNESLLILNNISDVFETEGIKTIFNAKFVGKGGVLIQNDLEFEYDNTIYIVELKLLKDISWEQISQFLNRLNIMRINKDKNIEGIMILISSPPSDITRIYAENSGIKLFWFSDASQLIGKKGINNIKYILKALKV
jgi:hypothetical protein